MDTYIMGQQLRIKSIYDITLKVSFYARVSSESDDQLNSLANQISYYEDLIKNNPNWTYVEGYIDEGLSAATTKRRENFHRMVADGKKGKFDLIITKEITRFARNTLDSIRYTRELLSSGVGVFFQSDNINTFDEDSELRLTIMSGIAQDELRKLSSRIKFGHQQAIKNGVVLGNSRMYGYQKDNGKLVIDEEEAKMVSELFSLYATGEYSMKQLEEMLWQKGYCNHNGNKIAHTTMSSIISNPKYKGYYVGGKVKIIDLFTKKQKFLPPEDWVIYKDESGETIPAIVDEDLWEAANNVLKKRSEDVKNRRGICNHANLLTGKLVCTHCGLPYYRRASKDKEGNTNSKWVCSGKLKRNANSCDSFAIYESDIKPLLFDVFNKSGRDTEAMIETYIKMFEKASQMGNIPKKIIALERRIEAIEKKRQKLLGYNVAGKISDSEFLNMHRQCSDEIVTIQDELDELIKQQDSALDFQTQVDSIRDILREASEDSEHVISKSFVDKYIDKIFVTPENGELLLEIKIFTGDTIQRHLSSLGVRMGQLSKKMIEAYENGIK